MFQPNRVLSPLRRAFTLVEMLIVVVVLITLMSITFRLMSLGDDNAKRATTVARMQRLENCLSGYYAAFGSYPPVRLHGSQDITVAVDDLGLQDPDEKTAVLNWNWYNDNDANHGIYTTQAQDAWRHVEAACRAQPVGCAFPYPDNASYTAVVRERSDRIKKLVQENTKSAYKNLSEERRQLLSHGFDALQQNAGSLSRTEDEWGEVQLFKFGLMSYLLPRYQVMMHGNENFFRSGSGGYAQWNNNNQAPADPYTGKTMNFVEIRRIVTGEVSSKKEEVKVRNMPTEAACARWMQNLEGVCTCTHNYRLYGIDIRSTTVDAISEAAPGDLKIYSRNGYGSTDGLYVLDSVTVLDGWDNEFYYYSPPPYQSYTLWSAGANGRTYPPWVPRDNLSVTEIKCIGAWTHDDIIHLSN